MSIDKVQSTDRTTLLQIIARNLLVAAGVLDSNSLPMVQVTDRTTLLQIIAAASIDLAAGGGGGGGVAWGAITGTLPSQTDLQNALNAKVSKSGDTMTGPLVNPVLVQPATEVSVDNFQLLPSSPDQIYAIDPVVSTILLPPLAACVEGKIFILDIKTGGMCGFSCSGADTVSSATFADNTGFSAVTGVSITAQKATTSLGVTWLIRISAQP